MTTIITTITTITIITTVTITTITIITTTTITTITTTIKQNRNCHVVLAALSHPYITVVASVMEVINFIEISKPTNKPS